VTSASGIQSHVGLVIDTTRSGGLRKGRNDRCVPLPQATLDALREHWLTHRNPNWLFPARADLKNIATATKPISERSVQRVFAQVAQSVGLKKRHRRRFAPLFRNSLLAMARTIRQSSVASKVCCGS
jgi:integrase